MTGGRQRHSGETGIQRRRLPVGQFDRTGNFGPGEVSYKEKQG